MLILPDGENDGYDSTLDHADCLATFFAIFRSSRVFFKVKWITKY